MPRPIGVIGGLGPHAGLLLVERIFAATRAVRDQDHLPVALLSYGHQVPDRTAFLTGDEPVNPAGPILDVAADLARLGVGVAGIPCNTAHAPPIFDAIRAGLPDRAPGLRLLHLIEETVAFAAEVAPGAERIGVLATRGTYATGIYPDALARTGLTAVLPDEAVREEAVHRAIYDPEWGIKARPDPVTDRAVDALRDAIEHLARHGAQAVILGCTELSVAFQTDSGAALPLIDATTALARALVRASAPDRLLPLA